MNAIKIGGVVLVLGTIILFFVFSGQGEKSGPSTPPPPPTPPIQDLNPTSTSAIPNSTTSVPEIPATSKKKETVAPPVKCKFQEFTVKLISNTDAEPASLVVHAGDTVTFINEDNNLHWPGADPHPTHSGLPSFDATGGISKGQSYSHTFTKIGKFGWHEHLIDPDPPTIGFINVLPCSA